MLAPSPLTVTADNKSIIFGAPIPPLTNTISGFVGGDTATSNDIIGSATCATTANILSPVGTYPITCTAGTLSSDHYGFTTFTPGALKVLYRFDGFLQPINDTAHQIGQSLSVFKAGSTIPVKLQLKKADGTPIQAAISPQWLSPQKGSAMSASVDETSYTDAASTGSNFMWDATTKQYTYNWNTKGFSSGYWYKVSVKLNDGTTQLVTVGLR